MAEPPLSARERRVLAEIEEGLKRDERLARRLGTMSRSPRDRPPSAAGARHRLPGLAVALSGVTSLVLLVCAGTTGAPLLIWLFAAVWVVTLLSLGGLLVRASRRWSAETRKRGNRPGDV